MFIESKVIIFYHLTKCLEGSIYCISIQWMKEMGDGGPSTLAIFSAFPGLHQGAGSEVEQLGLKQVLTWNVGHFWSRLLAVWLERQHMVATVLGSMQPSGEDWMKFLALGLPWHSPSFYKQLGWTSRWTIFPFSVTASAFQKRMEDVSESCTTWLRADHWKEKRTQIIDSNIQFILSRFVLLSLRLYFQAKALAHGHHSPA